MALGRLKILTTDGTDRTKRSRSTTENAESTKRSRRLGKWTQPLADEDAPFPKFPALRSFVLCGWPTALIRIKPNSVVQCLVRICSHKTRQTGASLCPGGTSDNSPTFQRWEPAPAARQVPQGRLTDGAGFQPSLRDLCISKHAYPTLKRWAIIGHPSGMRSRLPSAATLEEVYAIHAVGCLAMGVPTRQKAGKGLETW